MGSHFTLKMGAVTISETSAIQQIFTWRYHPTQDQHEHMMALKA
jgi:hypothetical protein